MAKSISGWRCPSEWEDWSDWLAAGLHGRCRWRLGVVVMGLLFAGGRRTVTSWLRAAGVGRRFTEYYYFVSAVGRRAERVGEQLLVLVLRTLPLPERLLAVIDDTPTKRYGPKVEGAGLHHNPTPGPADQKYIYGHIWVTLSLAVRHRRWGALALPLRAMLYVRRATMASIPRRRGWEFHTKLELASELVRWMAAIVQKAGKTLWVVVDGFYTKRPFLRGAAETGVVVVGRLRHDARLYDLPPTPRRGQRRRRGRPRIYGLHRISLAKRAGHKGGWHEVACTLYNQQVLKTCKSFLATYRSARGVIRVVLVKEDHGWIGLMCTDPAASVKDILEAFADRATIEQDFHDLKEVWGAGQQQVRHIGANVGAFHLNLWMHTLTELWAFGRDKAELCDRRDSPWDDASRRPSHADRRKALRRWIMRNELSSVAGDLPLPPKILQLTRRLMKLAA